MSVSYFVIKLKTAYEMRISDWSSDVCSSDLLHYPALCGKFNIRHRYSPEGEMCCSATRIAPPRCTSARKPAELCSAGFPFQRKISNYSLGIGTALKNAEMVARTMYSDRKSTRMNSSH